jgi:hypothetical protein
MFCHYVENELKPGVCLLCRNEVTSLRSILLCDFLWYVILRRIVPGPKPPSTTQLLRKTGVTMVTIGFGLYHGLWLDDAPTKRIGIIPTPWTMTRVLGFAEILQAHE